MSNLNIGTQEITLEVLIVKACNPDNSNELNAF